MLDIQIAEFQFFIMYTWLSNTTYLILHDINSVAAKALRDMTRGLSQAFNRLLLALLSAIA
jgi:hypothetical protein